MLTYVDAMKRNESFVFYLQPDDEASSSTSRADPNAFHPAEGEQEIARACKMVIYYPPFSDNRTGILGTLYCTTLRLVFVPATGDDCAATSFRTSRVFSSFKYETPLLNICQVQYASGPEKKMKTLTSFLQHLDQVVIVKIFCKDFRIFTFDFKSSEGYRALLNAMLRYAFPLKLNNVVSVYRQFSISRNNHHISSTSSPTNNDEVASFDTRTDWEAEMRRTNACAFPWRVTQVNMGRRYVEGYPEHFVVPTMWLDNMISTSCCNWTNLRVPVWCWSSPEGFALIRSSTLSTNSEVTEKQWLEVENAIAATHPNKLSPVEVDTTVNLQDVATAFEALRKLCSADAGATYWQTDGRWLSEIESTGWSNLVMKCLSTTEQVVNLISRARRTVIIIESGNADIACVISSLAQLCLDPYFRTFDGFAVLLQKEWVALSHPFALRLFGLGSESRSDEALAPVFLLFLDCVFQLQLQYPFSFAFSSHYLIALWDLSLTGLTRTFLFNNLRESDNFKGHSMRSAWRSSEAYFFTAPYRRLFPNSLYAFCRGLQPLAEEETTSSNSSPSPFSSTLAYFNARSISEGGGGGDSTPIRFRNRRDHRNHHQITDDRKADYQIISKYNIDSNCSAGDRSILLIPNASVAAYRFWDECYLRWSTPAQTLRGGRVQSDLQITAILSDISDQLNELRYLRRPRKNENDSESEAERTTTTKFANQLRQYRVFPISSNLNPESLDRITSAFPFGWDTIPIIPDYLYILPLLRNNSSGNSEKQQSSNNNSTISIPRSDLELATLNLSSPQSAGFSCERLSIWGGDQSPAVEWKNSSTIQKVSSADRKQKIPLLPPVEGKVQTPKTTRTKAPIATIDNIDQFGGAGGDHGGGRNIRKYSANTMV